MIPRPLLSAIVAVFFGFPLSLPASEESTEAASKTGGKADLPSTEEEARGRARLLHETIHGSLQVMHRDFFAGDENLSLPSQSLEDVFKELARSWSIEIRWLGINATKDVDHKPQDDFEKRAAAAILEGATEYHAVERGAYRHVGAIKIQNECLKCHVPNRTSLEDRFAGLAIKIPLKPAATTSED